MNINRSLSISYSYSCDISLSFRVKICSLEGFNLSDINRFDSQIFSSFIFNHNYSEFFVLCQLYDDGVASSCPVNSSYNSSFSQTKCVWNEWLFFNLPCQFLSRKSMLVFTIYHGNHSTDSTIFGGSSIPIFDDWAVCQNGIIDLKVWLNTSGCGLYNGCSTPGYLNDKSTEIGRLSEYQRMYTNSHIAVSMSLLFLIV